MSLAAEHIAQRRGRVTSSVVAGALGRNPHMTPLQAWLVITGRAPWEGSKATDRGSRLEDLVLDYPCDELGLKRFAAPFVSLPEMPWAGDSADALYGRSRRRPLLVGEGKTAALFTAAKYGAEGTDEIPESTLIQSHWHLIHWPQVERCAVPVLVGGHRFEFRAYYVDRDEEIAGILVDRAAQFHRDYVVTDMPPPAAANDTEAIAGLYPWSTAPALVADAQLEELARAYDAARAVGKAAEAEKERLANELRMALGEHESAGSPRVSIVYRSQKPRLKTDWVKVAAEAGVPIEIVRKHSVEVPGARPLRVTIKEER